MNIREQQKIDTKARIVAAVEKLSEIYGIENLKVREICKEATVSIGTFYNYYDSIESLIIDRIVSNDAELKERLQGKMTDENELVNMETYIRFQVGCFRKLPTSLLKEVFRIFIYHPDMEILEVNRTAFDIIYGVIERGKEKGQINNKLETATMTKIVLKLIIGNCFMNCMHSENYDFTQTLVDEAIGVLKV